MSKTKDTIDKAYSNVPKEVGLTPNFDFFEFRGIRYYWALFKRRFLR